MFRLFFQLKTAFEPKIRFIRVLHLLIELSNVVPVLKLCYYYAFSYFSALTSLTDSVSDVRYSFEMKITLL